jgi:hypothetical protein
MCPEKYFHLKCMKREAKAKPKRPWKPEKKIYEGS